MSTRRVLTTSTTAPVPGLLAWPHPSEGPAEAPRRPAGTGRVLIGGVGYTNLRDRSFGPLLIERLQARAWPADVVVEDVSYGPIDVLFKLQAEPSGFRLGVFIAAVARGRPEGTVERRLWQPLTPSLEELQERIAEAVTGVVSLENLLHILAHFGALPARTVIVEVEPEVKEGWGPDLSAPARAALQTVEELILDEVARASGGADDV